MLVPRLICCWILMCGCGTSTALAQRAIPIEVRLGDRGTLAVPVLGRPFSIVTTTTIFKTKADGSIDKTVIQTREMRDAEGRTRRETGDLKDDGTFQSVMAHVIDPVSYTATDLFLLTKTATVKHFEEPKPRSPEDEAKLSEARARAEAYRKEHPAKVDSNVTVEKLPDRMIFGVRATGTRTTRINPAGQVGNDRETKAVVESWYSPDFKLSLEFLSDDPRTYKRTSVTSKLSRDSPDAAMFQIPADFKVADQKIDASSKQ